MKLSHVSRAAALALPFGFFPATTLADIYISQYYEGPGTSKWIEIYNSGTSAVNFSTADWRLGLWQNAVRQDWKTGTAPSQNVLITDTIAAGGAIVFANSGNTAPTYLTPVRSNVVSNTVINFNGDDSVVLYTGSTYAFANVVDALGLVGNSAADTSYSRATTVTSGVNTDFNAADWNTLSNATVDGAAITVDGRIGVYKRGGISVVWDTNGNTSGTGGTGAWNVTSAFFTSKAGGSATAGDYYAYNESNNRRDNVIFGGTAGTVTLPGDRTTGGLVFTTSNYQIAGTDTLFFDGTGNIDVVGTSTTATISSKVGTNTGVNIRKLGTGALILSAANTYTGTTTVTAGTLRLNGTHTGGGAYTVQTGATLGGNGSTASAVTIQSGGTLSPGNSIGTITVGSLNLEPSANYVMDVNAANGTEAADLTVVTAGDVTLGDGANFPTIEFVFTPGFVATFGTAPAGKTFLIVNNTGSGVVTSGSQFAGAPNGTEVIDGLLRYTINYAYTGAAFNGTASGGNDIAVTFHAVPEPASMLLTAAAGMLITRRRRA